MNFKAWRESKGHSQDKVGKLLGVGQSMVSKLERGRKPNLDLLVRISGVTKGKVGLHDFKDSIAADSPAAIGSSPSGAVDVST